MSPTAIGNENGGTMWTAACQTSRTPAGQAAFLRRWLYEAALRRRDSFIVEPTATRAYLSRIDLDKLKANGGYIENVENFPTHSLQSSAGQMAGFYIPRRGKSV